MAVSMKGPCEHCGNPDKSKWLQDCKFKGDFPSRRAFVLSTFDAPCSCDAYNEGQAERARSKNRAVFWIVVAVAVAMGAAVMIGMARAHDSGQWGNSDPAIRQWYQALMQPDVPYASCCGEADAYWADEIHILDGRTFATITDDRDDAPLGRPHVENGTVVEIPNHKLKWDKSNPTGHGVVFLSRQGFVFCYVQAGGA